jgi:hypothetical protein
MRIRGTQARPRVGPKNSGWNPGLRCFHPLSELFISFVIDGGVDYRKYANETFPIQRSRYRISIHFERT